MKKLSLTFALILYAFALTAQVPAGFSYQAVVRNNDGNVVANQPVKFRISILGDSEAGTAVYVETHSVTTNAFGLANLTVGMGTSVSGSFSNEGWGAASHFMKVEIDPDNGSTFSHLGTMQLFAVPYAFHAQTVELDQVDDADADATNEIQELELSGTVLGLSKSSKTVILPSSGGGDNWGTQVVHTDATLEGQGITALPLKIAQQSATSGQVLKWSGTTWAPATDEMGEGGSNPTGPAGGDLTGTYPNPTIGDMKVTSAKIQDGTIKTDDLAGDIITTWKIVNGAVTGEKIAQSGATTGQVLKWNGTIWSPAVDESGGGFTLPWSGTANNTTQALKISNTGSGTAIYGESATGSGVFGMTDGTNTSGIFGLAHASSGVNYGVRGENDSSDGYSGYFLGNKFYVSGNTGLGVENPSVKLDIDGQVKIRGGSPGDGKVLTSDASGLAAWQTPAEGGLELPYSGSVTTGGIIFELTCNGGQGLTSTAWLSGLVGKSNSSQASGVMGEGATGVLGRSNSSTGAGISGQQINSGGYSGYFSGGKFHVSGNVGINTTNPSGDLTIDGTTGVATMNLVNDDSGGNLTDGLKISLGNNSTGYLINQENAALVFGTNNTNRIVIQPNGHIGIGTTIPSFLLDVNGPINLNKAVATGIAMYCKGDEALWYNGTYFSWGYAGSYNFIGNKLKIGGNGNIAPAYTLYVDGTAAKSSAGTAWVVSSDQRLKNVTGEYKKGLAEISLLNPVVFSFKEDNPRNLPSGNSEVGFLAQEVQKIFPEAVSEAKDGYLDFDIHPINVALINAVKELKTENAFLKERLEKLEQHIGEITKN